MAITHDPNKLPKVGAIVSSIKIFDNAAGGDIAEIEFIDSDCEQMSHGYVPHDKRKRIAIHLRFERNQLEKEILEKYIYHKDAVGGFATEYLKSSTKENV